MSKKFLPLILSFCMVLSPMYAAQLPNNDNFNPEVFWSMVSERLPQLKIPNDIGETNLVLILGNTGVGKSTLINSWLGHTLGWKEVTVERTIKSKKNNSHKKIAIRKRCICVKEKKAGVPIAEIGNEKFKSRTMFPKGYMETVENSNQNKGKKQGKERFTFLDCAGFGDTAGSEQELFNLMLIFLFARKAKSIKAVICLVEHRALNSSKGGAFLECAHYIEGIMKAESVIDNIFWVFTRTPEHINEDHIMLDLQEMLEIRQSKQDDVSKTRCAILKSIVESEQVYVAHPLIERGSYQDIREGLLALEKDIPKESLVLNRVKGVEALPGCMRRLFLDKGPAIESYRKKKRLQKYVEDTKKDKKSNIIQRREDRINEIKKQATLIQEKIDKINKEVDGVTLFRTIPQHLSARWFSDTKTICYDDLPFDPDKSNVNYKKEVSERVIERRPQRGLFKAKYTLKGDTFKTDEIVEKASKGAEVGAKVGAKVGTGAGAVVVGAAAAILGAATIIATGGGSLVVIGGATLVGAAGAKAGAKAGAEGGAVVGAVVGAGVGAGVGVIEGIAKMERNQSDVNAHFYVKNKFIMKEELERQYPLLREKNDKINEHKKFINDLKSNKILLSDLEDVLDQKIMEMDNELKEAKSRYEKDKIFLDFIYETYGIFNMYNVPDYLQIFIDEYDESPFPQGAYQINSAVANNQQEKPLISLEGEEKKEE